MAVGVYERTPEIKKILSQAHKGKPSNHQVEKVSWKCKNCGKIEHLLPSRAKQKKYCSHKCVPIWNKGKPHYQIRGENHWNWNNGSSRIFKDGYNSFEYRMWRREVFERDNYICQKCEIKGNETYLTAHHIQSMRNYPELKYDIDNGLTLCENCHSQTDNYKGRAIKKELELCLQ